MEINELLKFANENHVTALIMATKLDDLDAIKLLIKSEVNVLKNSQDGLSPMQQVSWCAPPPKLPVF